MHVLNLWYLEIKCANQQLEMTTKREVSEIVNITNTNRRCSLDAAIIRAIPIIAIMGAMLIIVHELKKLDSKYNTVSVT